jgi:4-hydroxyacetophenone monooxygenase
MVMQAKRPELLEASDETIEDAVKYADPMVLRGLVYQLTGDESLGETKLDQVEAGFLTMNMVVDPEEVARIQSKAADFLKSYRDAGAGDIAIGPADP